MEITEYLRNLFQTQPKLPNRGGRNVVRSDMNPDFYPGGDIAPSNQWALFKYLFENNSRFPKDRQFPGLESFNDDPELLRKFYLELMNKELNEGNNWYTGSKKRKVEM